MDVYLSAIYINIGNLSKSSQGLQHFNGIPVLDSFYYFDKQSSESIRDWERVRSEARKVMIDSGCFTFMSNAAKAKDLSAYTERYCDFIKRYNVDLFVEMDVDALLGLKKAEQLRARIECLTGRQPIPVWHPSRGKDYWLGMCKDYPYVAYGGLITDGYSRQACEKTFPWFIEKAHENGAKIHGLGYTSVQGLHRYRFDSVDSSSWTSGQRYGSVYLFNPRTGDIKVSRKGLAKKDLYHDVSAHNLREWSKFALYAKDRL